MSDSMIRIDRRKHSRFSFSIFYVSYFHYTSDTFAKLNCIYKSNCSPDIFFDLQDDIFVKFADVKL